MEDIGVIGYRAQLSHLNRVSVKAIITLKHLWGKLKPFIEKVKLKEVVNYRVTGNENIVMEVVLKDGTPRKLYWILNKENVKHKLYCLKLLMKNLFYFNYDKKITFSTGVLYYFL